MTTFTLNLSPELRQFVANEARAGQFDGPEGYIEALIARAKDGKARLTELLIEGMESGEPIALDDVEWSRIRRDVQQRLAHG